MQKRDVWLIIGAVVLLAAAVAVWFVFHPPFSGDSAPESSAPESAETTRTTTTTTADEDVVAPGTLTFTGKVLEVNDGMALMECYDKNKFDTVLVNYSATPSVTPQVGEEYLVEYEDFMMPSLPPRIFSVKMELVSSTPTASAYITEERAIEIAEGYWKMQSGDRDPKTGYLMSVHVMGTPTVEKAQYRMALWWLVEVDGVADHYSTLDVVIVDAITGEILPADSNGIIQ